ncbi:hypothetical protein [Streptococcus merionis]|uniref:Uncharacterized protein n=1 Tax=Streptococcus merionis TaxID=400065 RepID=A0A239SX87_9STRE|nr:hypothetical protein [Streptococcus merionis]SNU89213.1 Uncharacterised protein [Streptococcus merionis]
MSFEYYYRKGQFIFQALIGLFLLGFIASWSFGAFTIIQGMSRFPRPSGANPFFFIQAIFFIVPILMTIIGLSTFGQALLKIFYRKPVVAGDAQGLKLLGRWLKSYHLLWGDIDYVRHEYRTSHVRYNHSSNHFRQSHWLIVKPKEGRAIEIDIANIDGTIDDIVADIKKMAPHVVVKGMG